MVPAYRQGSSPYLKTAAPVSRLSISVNVQPFPLVYLEVKTVTLDLGHSFEDFRRRLKCAAGKRDHGRVRNQVGR